MSCVGRIGKTSSRWPQTATWLSSGPCRGGKIDGPPAQNRFPFGGGGRECIEEERDGGRDEIDDQKFDIETSGTWRRCCHLPSGNSAVAKVSPPILLSGLGLLKAERDHLFRMDASYGIGREPDKYDLMAEASTKSHSHLIFTAPTYIANE